MHQGWFLLIFLEKINLGLKKIKERVRRQINIASVRKVGLKWQTEYCIVIDL